MAVSLRTFDSGLFSSLGFRPDFRRNLNYFHADSEFSVARGKVCRLRSRRCLNVGFKVRFELREGDGGSTAEEPPESLFLKEMKKRGMTPTSLLEDRDRSVYGNGGDVNLKGNDGGFSEMNAVSTDTEESLSNQRERSMALNNGGDVNSKENDGGFSEMNAVSTDTEESLSNQRERSMALNSEGLEGLIPRAKLLLGTGGTFFIGFWPFIIVTVAFFSALYIYFGQSFIHDGSNVHISTPLYDPYTLLEDGRVLSRTIHVK